MNVTRMSPARLEAFVDGELTPEEAAEVLMHLARSPEDRAHVERLERVNQTLAEIYALPLAQPVPDELRRRILGPEADGVRALPWRRAPAAWLAAGAAMAASVALAIGLIGGLGALRDAPAPFEVSAGPVAAGTPLWEVLDRQPSGAPRAVGDDVVLLVVGTFLDGADRPCREFEAVRAAEREIEHAIACRTSAGEWQVEVAVAQEMLADGPTAYTPAEGPGGAALQEALNALGAGPLLSPDDERRLLAASFAPNG